MLRACARVLREGGLVAFVVIATADGLGPDDLLHATDVGPTDADASPGYPALLGDSGFVDVVVDDVTDQYRETLRGWIEAWDDEAGDLAELVGAGEFDERQSRRRAGLVAIDDGLLKRYAVRAVRGSGPVPAYPG